MNTPENEYKSAKTFSLPSNLMIICLIYIALKCICHHGLQNLLEIKTKDTFLTQVCLLQWFSNCGVPLVAYGAKTGGVECGKPRENWTEAKLTHSDALLMVLIVDV